MKAIQKDMEELKEAMNMLTSEVANITKQNSVITELLNEIKLLKKQNTEKSREIDILNRRVDELEQYTRMDDLIITGLKTNHRSYAGTVSSRDTGEDAPTRETESLEQQVVRFFQGRDMPLQSEHISVCHTLPRGRNNTQQPPPIVVRFSNRKYKNDLLHQGRKLKGTNVYINEHLTKQNATIAREARILRKEKKIKETWTRNCKVYVRLNGASTESERVLIVRAIEELKQCISE